jgi:hypothetical protein
MEKVQTSVILSVINHHQNTLESAKVDRIMHEAIEFIWLSDGEDLSQGNWGPSLDARRSRPEYKLEG